MGNSLGAAIVSEVEWAENSAVHFDYIFNQAHNTLFEEEKEAEHSTFQKSRKTRKAQSWWPSSNFAFLGCHWMFSTKRFPRAEPVWQMREMCPLESLWRRLIHHTDLGISSLQEKKRQHIFSNEIKEQQPWARSWLWLSEDLFNNGFPLIPTSNSTINVGPSDRDMGEDS